MIYLILKIYIITIIFFLHCHCTATIFERNNKKVEEIYLQKFRSNNNLDSICNLPPRQKYALCAIILENGNYGEELNSLVYFNKIAAVELAPECDEKLVTFEEYTHYSSLPIKQKMFPCYGRHNPVRTNWQMDDYFDTIYLSGGDSGAYDSVFTYIHTKHIGFEMYVLSDFVSNLDIANLPPLDVTEREILDEVKLNLQLSYNPDVFEVETNYIREFLLEGNRPKTNSVCDLSVEIKMALCEKILGTDFSQRLKWTIDENAFGTRSVKCERKKIHFVHATNYNDIGLKENMFPCFGNFIDPEEIQETVSTTVRLATGYRINSIAIFVDGDDENDEYEFFEFVENVNFFDLESNSIPTSKSAGLIGNYGKDGLCKINSFLCRLLSFEKKKK